MTTFEHSSLRGKVNMKVTSYFKSGYTPNPVHNRSAMKCTCAVVLFAFMGMALQLRVTYLIEGVKPS